KWRAELFIAGSRVASRGGFERRKPASDWLDEARRVHAASGQERAPELQFEALVAKFESHHMPTLRPLTQRRYRIDIHRRLLPFFKYRSVSKITSLMLEDFKAE